MKKLIVIAAIIAAIVALTATAALAESIWTPWTERVTLGVVFTTPQGNIPSLEVNLKGQLAGKNPGKRSVGNSRGVVAGTVAGYGLAEYRGRYSVDATITWLDETAEEFVGGDANELLDLTVMPVKASGKAAEAFRLLSAGKVRQAERNNLATKVARWEFDGANGSIGLQAEEYRVVREDGVEFYALVVLGRGTERTVTRKSNGGSNGGSSSNPPSGGNDDTPSNPPSGTGNEPDPYVRGGDTVYDDEQTSGGSGTQPDPYVRGGDASYDDAGSSSSSSSTTSTSDGEFTVVVQPAPHVRGGDVEWDE